MKRNSGASRATNFTGSQSTGDKARLDHLSILSSLNQKISQAKGLRESEFLIELITTINFLIVCDNIIPGKRCFGGYLSVEKLKEIKDQIDFISYYTNPDLKRRLPQQQKGPLGRAPWGLEKPLLQLESVYHCDCTISPSNRRLSPHKCMGKTPFPELRIDQSRQVHFKDIDGTHKQFSFDNFADYVFFIIQELDGLVARGYQI